MMGAPATRSGSRPSGGAATASPAKPSIPSASRRRTFKPFAQAPRDGTAFIVPHIARYNPFAKTFEMLMRDQYSGELEWTAVPRVWSSIHFCDLLPLPYDLPKFFTMTLVASPARRPSWRERIMEKLFGWLRLPDTVSLMQYCWRASAMSAFGQDAEERLEAKPASAVANGETPTRPNPSVQS